MLGIITGLTLMSPAALAQNGDGQPIVTATAEPAATAGRTEPNPATATPFAAMAGTWSGGGTISVTGGSKERLRCKASHTAGSDATSLVLNIRCASDSYKFELTSKVSETQGRLSGNWNETSTGVAGSISGEIDGNHISATAEGKGYTAGISVTTEGKRQSVSITPNGSFITGVQIALSKR